MGVDLAVHQPAERHHGIREVAAHGRILHCVVLERFAQELHAGGEAFVIVLGTGGTEQRVGQLRFLEDRDLLPAFARTVEELPVHGLGAGAHRNVEPQAPDREVADEAEGMEFLVAVLQVDPLVHIGEGRADEFQLVGIGREGAHAAQLSQLLEDIERQDGAGLHPLEPADAAVGVLEGHQLRDRLLAEALVKRRVILQHVVAHLVDVELVHPRDNIVAFGLFCLGKGFLHSVERRVLGVFDLRIGGTELLAELLLVVFVVVLAAEDERGGLGEGNRIRDHGNLVLLAIGRGRGDEPDLRGKFSGTARRFHRPGHLVLCTGEQRALLALEALQAQFFPVLVAQFDIGRSLDFPVAQVHDLALEHQAVAFRDEERHIGQDHQFLLYDKLGRSIARMEPLVVRKHQHAESTQQVARFVADLRQARRIGLDLGIEGDQLAEVAAAFEFRNLFLFLV